jgi:hypothetical protein
VRWSAIPISYNVNLHWQNRYLYVPQARRHHRYAVVALDDQFVVRYHIVVGESECFGCVVPYDLYQYTYLGWASPDVRPGDACSSQGNGRQDTCSGVRPEHGG